MAPPNTPRTVAEAVAEALSGVEPIGYALSLDDVLDRYNVVGPAEAGVPVVATVTSTPRVFTAADPGFRQGFDGHVGTHLFSLSLIEERKVDLLAHAFETHADADGRLDLAYVSRFAFTGRETLTAQRPSPSRIGKRMRVTLMLSVADARDGLGRPIMNVESVTPPESTAGRDLGALLQGRAASTTPRDPAVAPPAAALAVHGDGHAGPDGDRLVAEIGA